MYEAIMRAKSVQQVQFAFREHRETCPKCMAAPNRAIPMKLGPTAEGTGRLPASEPASAAPRKSPALATVQGEDEQERAA